MSHGYGQSYEQPTGIAFAPGINKGVYLTGFEVVDISTAKYEGKALDVTFSKDGDSISVRKFPVNEANKPREITEKGGNKRMQTMDEAIREAYTKFNSWCKHIVDGYVSHLPESYGSGVYEKGGLFDRETAKATSFETFIAIVKKFLPAGFEKIPGELIVGYDNKGYLQVPGEMWLTGYFWSPEGSGKRLEINPKYIRLVRPVQAQAAPTETPESDTNW